MNSYAAWWQWNYGQKNENTLWKAASIQKWFTVSDVEEKGLHKTSANTFRMKWNSVSGCISHITLMLPSCLEHGKKALIPSFAAITAYSLFGRLSTECWNMDVGICGHSDQRGICHWWANVGLQLVSQLIL